MDYDFGRYGKRQKGHARNRRIKRDPKIKLIFPVLLILIIGILITGLVGKNQKRTSPAPTKSPDTSSTDFPSITPSLKPESTEASVSGSKPTPKVNATQTSAVLANSYPSVVHGGSLSYNLPSDWKVATDFSGNLSVGYDASKYDTLIRNKNIMLIVPANIRSTTSSSSRRFYMTHIRGVSNQKVLYSIVNVSPTTSDWKSKSYSEREYLYNGWNCLVMNGIEIPHTPVAWALCPVSANLNLVMNFDTNNWSDIEQQLSAVKFTE